MWGNQTKIYKDHAPSITTIRYCFDEFKRDQISVIDEERPGRLIGVTTEDMVNKIYDIVLADRRIQVREIGHNLKEFLRHFVTVDKTWIYHHMPEIKKNSQTVAKKIGQYWTDLKAFFTMTTPLSTRRPTAKLVELRHGLLPHPPYFPHLASCDFFCFQAWKIDLAESDSCQTRKSSPKQRPISGRLSNHNLDGLKKLAYHWTKCIEAKEEK